MGAVSFTARNAGGGKSWELKRRRILPAERRRTGFRRHAGQRSGDMMGAVAPKDMRGPGKESAGVGETKPSLSAPFSMSLAFRKSHIAFASLGAIVAVSALAYVASTTKGLMLLGSFGASALLLFALPEAPLSQPASVLLGHLSASVIALACLTFFGPHWWAMGVATGLSIGFMMLTRTVHPPAGSNAIIVFLAKPDWWFLVSSTIAGTATLIAIACVYHRTTGRHKYPVTWRSAPLRAS